MSLELFLLITTNFAAIGLLPRLFFRRNGRLNARWWLTAAPFLGCYLLQVAAFAGWIEPSGLAPAAPLAALAVVLSMGSTALIGLAVGSHRVPVALWHQADDAPQQLVTWGAYRRIRHPFYSAFLLALGAGLLLVPHPATLLTFAYGLAVLTVTARREERRLRGSAFGQQYRAYTRGTGRFLPKLRKAPA
ncbi:MAG TPA: isoprenylcysteine carboxylmethyltransferase family protein [Egibacteraceae bacterium]|nr:isoprenylcysteine carboxylmethyltransferase family protein [Egibacteraceae bacterium]